MMPARKGATLVEVLIASFVMAIGLISLLALFPLGALEMAQAIKDGRTAESVANATAIATTLNVRHDTLPANTPLLLAIAKTDSVSTAFDNPFDAIYVTASPDGPSYPVYLDPVGFMSYIGGRQGNSFLSWIGGKQGTVTRRNLSLLENATAAARTPLLLQWFTITDDLTFGNNGVPTGASGNLERDSLYSWAYLLRRPRNGNPSVVEMWVIVYYRRPLSAIGTGTAAGSGETVYSNAFVMNSGPLNTVRLDTTPPYRAPQVGEWLLDCTPGPPDPKTGKKTPGTARFFRVLGVTDNGNSVDVETDGPIEPLARPATTPIIQKQIVLMEGVAEVVYRGTNWRP